WASLKFYADRTSRTCAIFQRGLATSALESGYSVNSWDAPDGERVLDHCGRRSEQRRLVSRILRYARGLRDVRTWLVAKPVSHASVLPRRCNARTERCG